VSTPNGNQNVNNPLDDYSNLPYKERVAALHDELIRCNDPARRAYLDNLLQTTVADHKAKIWRWSVIPVAIAVVILAIQWMVFIGKGVKAEQNYKPPTPAATCTVPTGVVGADETDARTALKNAGFTNIPDALTATPGTVDEPAALQAGQVMQVSPAEDSTAACDAQVKLTLASGKSQVPDLWGMTADQATTVANQAGFQISSSPKGYDANTCNSLPDTVCMQTPASASYAVRGSTIAISIAGAPPK